MSTGNTDIEQSGDTDPAGRNEALVMRKLLIHVYNSGYLAGHEDTVEARYTDIFPVDMDSYHDDVVAELVAELLADSGAEQLEI